MNTLRRALQLVASIRPVARLAHAVAQHDPRARDTYSALRAQFIANGRDHRITDVVRRDLVQRFERIDAMVPIQSTPVEGLILAEMILNVAASGAIVECGCYAGGSSAKLSILAKLLGRDLIVCDSFAGLPAPQGGDATDGVLTGRYRGWSAGQFGAGFDTVRKHIVNHGEPAATRYIAGWFAETLHALPDEIAFAFTDVDLAGSARDCLLAIWPRLHPGGIYTTHDTAFVNVLRTILDRSVWVDDLKDFPPVLFGAGYGMGPRARSLGYMVKGALDVDYIKQLAIRK
jgi:hypothetical protein